MNTRDQNPIRNFRRPIASTATRLQLAVNGLARRLRMEVPNADLSMSEMSALSRIDREGPCTTSKLAAAERIRAQSMASTLQSLQQKRLIEREEHLEDGRKILIKVTPAGKALLNNTRKSRQSWLATAIDAHLTPVEQKLIIDAVAILERLADCSMDVQSAQRTLGRKHT